MPTGYHGAACFTGEEPRGCARSDAGVSSLAQGPITRGPTDVGDGSETHLLRELVFEYLERADAEGAGVLEELCARRPESAEALRARVEILRGTGLSATRGADGRPERLGAFRLLERLGGGGMGVVYSALDESLGREVALKLIRPSELFFPGARERFRREVAAVARLSHPGIVPVYSAGEEDGVPYFAMERVDGCTLGEVLAELEGTGASPEGLTGAELGAAIARLTARDPDETDQPDQLDQPAGAEVSPFFDGAWGDVCARVVREVAEALEHAHRRGVLHRDVKPSNVMITCSGRVMLLDFGLSSAEGVDRITRPGSALGSLPYMSPEQLDGDWERLDARSDVYSLGVTLYELLTLALPFEEGALPTLRRAVLEGRAPGVRRRNPRVSWELETIVRGAMEPDRARRYASAAALAQDLSAALERRPIAARRAGPLRRARRWIARHPAGAAALGLTLLIVVGGPLLFGWQQRNARLAIGAQSLVIDRQRAELSGQNAELEATLGDLRAAIA
jgi:serine/threonine protein kinase